MAAATEKDLSNAILALSTFWTTGLGSRSIFIYKITITVHFQWFFDVDCNEIHVLRTPEALLQKGIDSNYWQKWEGGKLNADNCK